jgi:hypothetical protein
MSEDKRVLVRAVETLKELWPEPPILPERIPFIMFLAAEVAGEMQTTPYRPPNRPATWDVSAPAGHQWREAELHRYLTDMARVRRLKLPRREFNRSRRGGLRRDCPW